METRMRRSNLLWGERAYEMMTGIGFKAERGIYHGLGRWYKVPDEIDDFVEFIRTKAG